MTYLGQPRGPQVHHGRPLSGPPPRHFPEHGTISPGHMGLQAVRKQPFWTFLCWGRQLSCHSCRSQAWTPRAAPDQLLQFFLQEQLPGACWPGAAQAGGLEAPAFTVHFLSQRNRAPRRGDKHLGQALCIRGMFPGQPGAAKPTEGPSTVVSFCPTPHQSPALSWVIDTESGPKAAVGPPSLRARRSESWA